MQSSRTSSALRAVLPIGLGLGLLVGNPTIALGQTADEDPATNACTSAVIGTTSFTDIAGDTHVRAIECISAYGITAGATPTTYDPSAPLTRAQMASFLTNVFDIADVPIDFTDQGFVDIAGNVHEDNINAIALFAITVGTSPDRFSPEEPITRGQMATFIVEVDAVIGDMLPDGPDAFTDDDDSVHESNIDIIAAAEITFGTGDGRFSPTAPVTRGQMASFIARLLQRGVDVAEIPPLTFVAPELLG